jgi:hypothetical protein
LDPASTSEPATVGHVFNAAAGLAHVVRDCILELLEERFVTHPLWMADSQHVPGPPGDAQHITRRALKHFSDLCGSQSHVTRQDNGNSLVVGEGPEVGDDWLSGGNGRDAIDQLNPLPVFPGQVHWCAGCLHNGAESLQTRMWQSSPPPVEPGEDQLDNPIGLDWITREEVCRGLDKRTLALDHSGVFVIADRRHAPPLSHGNSEPIGMADAIC